MSNCTIFADFFYCEVISRIFFCKFFSFRVKVISRIFLRILEHCNPEAADDAIAGDDMMNDDDYLCRDLLVLENVEAIAVEDHISVSP